MMSHVAPTLVLCLCAEWCGVCRDYRSGFEELAARHDGAAFHWIDIEDAPDWPDTLDIESFPTVMIQRGDHVLYLGPTLPQHSHLERTLQHLLAMDGQQDRRYAEATEERRSWQVAAQFSERLR